MKKALLLFFLFVSLSVSLCGQTFQGIPAGFDPENRNDMYSYEKDILVCIDWLQETSPVIEQEKRAEAVRFLMQWIQNNAYVHIVTDSHNVVTFFNSTPEMRPYFAGGWVKYYLQNVPITDKVAGISLADLSREEVINLNEAGINAVLDFYTRYNGKRIINDPNINDLVKIREKGRLRRYLERNVRFDPIQIREQLNRMQNITR